MKSKIKVGILGATGMVGQNFITLLNDHEWFEINFLAASNRSAGKTYAEAVKGRWRMDSSLPDEIGAMPVFNVQEINKARQNCDFVFSAVAMSKKDTAAFEEDYAAAGFPVVSNNSAHRMTPYVPVIIPEINPEKLEIIPAQQKLKNWDKGFIVTKPNCGLQSYMLPLAALRQGGHNINRLITTNLQALSGAGYPGQSALDVIDNIIALPSEEEKALNEPQKILGEIVGHEIVPNSHLKISSNCIRVPVVHGHTSCVWFAVDGEQPEPADLKRLLRDFKGEPQHLELPSAPNPAIRYFDDHEHPQPRQDRDAGNGMAMTVGRLQEAPVLGYRFTALSHNTQRGAAGGAVLTAELLAARGYM